MRPLFIFLSAALLILSCREASRAPEPTVQRLMPDTAERWAGQQTGAALRLAKHYEQKFGLPSLQYGSATEVRLWYFSTAYDNQVLFRLREDRWGNWQLRTISFHRKGVDRIYADYSRQLRQSAVNSLLLSRYWGIPSQSEMKNGDQYGCVDGEEVLIELAEPNRYRPLWYRCPEINRDKDPAFLLAASLADRLDWLAVAH
jgi:hypothetical protein